MALSSGLAAGTAVFDITPTTQGTGNEWQLSRSSTRLGTLHSHGWVHWTRCLVYLGLQEWQQTLPGTSWRQTLLCGGLGAQPQSLPLQQRLMLSAMLRQLCWWDDSKHLTLGCFRCIWDTMLAHSHTLECTERRQCWHTVISCVVLLQTATSVAQGSAATEAAAALAGPVADVAKAQEQVRAREVSFHKNKLCKLYVRITWFDAGRALVYPDVDRQKLLAFAG